MAGTIRFLMGDHGAIECGISAGFDLVARDLIGSDGAIMARRWRDFVSKLASQTVLTELSMPKKNSLKTS